MSVETTTMYMRAPKVKRKSAGNINFPESIDCANWTKQRLLSEIQKGVDDANAGRVYPAKQAWSILDRVETAEG